MKKSDSTSFDVQLVWLVSILHFPCVIDLLDLDLLMIFEVRNLSFSKVKHLHLIFTLKVRVKVQSTHRFFTASVVFFFNHFEEWTVHVHILSLMFNRVSSQVLILLDEVSYAMLVDIE